LAHSNEEIKCEILENILNCAPIRMSGSPTAVTNDNFRIGDAVVPQCFPLLT